MKDRIIVLAIELQTRWKPFIIGLIAFSIIGLLIGPPALLGFGLIAAFFCFYMAWYPPASDTSKVPLKEDHWKFLLEHASPAFLAELLRAFPLTLKHLKEALEKAEEFLRDQQKAETTAQVEELLKGKADDDSAA